MAIASGMGRAVRAKARDRSTRKACCSQTAVAGAHAVRAAAELLHIDILDLLSEAELVAIEKIGDSDEIVLKTLESV